MVSLGLSHIDLYGLTLREFSFLLDRYVEREEREDRRFGRVVAMLANVNRDPKKRSKPYTEEDFIPRRAERKTQTVAEQKAILSQIGVR